MPEYFDLENEQRSLVHRCRGEWRVVASAWAVAILVVLAFGGVQALASRYLNSAQHQHLVGALIPRHDPNCDVAAGMMPDCRAVSGVVDEAQAEAEAHAAYGL